MGISVSNSELRTWQWCQRHWFLAYYHGYTMRPEHDRPVGDAKLGTRIHTTLELWYGYQQDPRRALSVIYDRARVRWSDDDAAEQLGKEQDLALAMVDGYVEWVTETGVDEGLTVIGVEDDIVVPSSYAEISFRAKLDQRVIRTQDGARLFLDHKTVGSFEHSTTILHMDPQMRFYAMLDLIQARAESNSTPHTDGGLWNMLRRSKRTGSAKPPFYKREEIRFNRDELRSTWIKANAIAKRISDTRAQLDLAGSDHRWLTPSNPGRDCVWRCQFVRVCPLMDDGSDWQRMLSDRYLVQDPYSYYQGDTKAIFAQLNA